VEADSNKWGGGHCTRLAGWSFGKRIRKGESIQVSNHAGYKVAALLAAKILVKKKRFTQRIKEIPALGRMVGERTCQEALRVGKRSSGKDRIEKSREGNQVPDHQGITIEDSGIPEQGRVIPQTGTRAGEKNFPQTITLGLNRGVPVRIS